MRVFLISSTQMVVNQHLLWFLSLLFFIVFSWFHIFPFIIIFAFFRFCYLDGSCRYHLTPILTPNIICFLPQLNTGFWYPFSLPSHYIVLGNVISTRRYHNPLTQCVCVCTCMLVSACACARVVLFCFISFVGPLQVKRWMNVRVEVVIKRALNFNNKDFELMARLYIFMSLAF